MKEKFTPQTLIVACMLLAAGLISPSNGVDDKVSKDPLTMLLETVTIVLVISSAYILFKKGKEFLSR